MTLPALARGVAPVLLVALLASAACVNIQPQPTATVAPSPIASRPPTASPSRAPSQPPTSAPTSGPSGSQSPGPTTPASPGPTVDPELASQIDAVTAQLPPVRGLDATTDVPYEFISRDQFRDELIELLNEEVSPEIRAAEERLLKRLGLLPDDADMEALILELYGAQVAAYYRPDTGRFYIIERDAPFGATDKLIVAHEYTHALQDQAFRIEENRIKDPFEGDAVLGQLAVIEGDATLTSQLWATDNLTPQELFELITESLSGLDEQTLEGMPLILRRQLEFPYVEGFLFVNSLHERGGFDAVNDAIRTPPASTEQILHPEKHLAGEGPVAVPLDDLSPTLGDGWSRVYQQTVGELGIQVLATDGDEPPFNIPGLPVEWPHAEVAAGWGGDRLAMYEHSDGHWALMWRTTWDAEGDANEFEVRVNELSNSFGGPTAVTRNGLTIDVIVALDQATLQLVSSH